MRGLKTVGLLAAVALVLAVVPAAAQTPGMTWSGSIYGGYAKITQSGFPSGSFGARGNLFAMFGPVIGIGPEVGYHLLGSDDLPTLLGGGKLKYSAIQATGQVIARGVRGSMRPFGTGGLGLYSLKSKLTDNTVPGANGSDTRSKFGFNLGGGIQYKPPTSSLGFGIEAKWHNVMKARTELQSDLTTKEKSLDIVTVMAGVNFK